jgi:hypothetical protein
VGALSAAVEQLAVAVAGLPSRLFLVPWLELVYLPSSSLLCPGSSIVAVATAFLWHKVVGGVSSLLR